MGGFGGEVGWVGRWLKGEAAGEGKLEGAGDEEEKE